MLAFIDMDGVLCDYNKAIHQRFKIDPSVYTNPVNLGRFELASILAEQYNIPKGVFYSKRGDTFYENLEWTPEGQDLLKLLESHFGKENCYIFTNPGLNAEDWASKVRWLQNNTKGYVSKGRVLMGKPKWVAANSGSYLFDDKDSNIKEFNEAGGIGVLIPRQWNSAFSEANNVLDLVKTRLSEFC